MTQEKVRKGGGGQGGGGGGGEGGGGGGGGGGKGGGLWAAELLPARTAHALAQLVAGISSAEVEDDDFAELGEMQDFFTAVEFQMHGIDDL